MSCNNSLGFFPANFSLQNNHQEEQEHPQFLFRPCTLPRDFHGTMIFSRLPHVLRMFLISQYLLCF